MLDCWRLDTSSRITADEILTRLDACVASSSGDISALNWPAVTQPSANSSQTAKQTTAPTGARMVAIRDGVVDLNAPDHILAFERLEISPTRLVVVRTLGSGQFGQVDLAHLKLLDQTGGNKQQAVAVKFLKDQSSDVEASKFLMEARILSSLRHQNIVSVIAVCFRSTPNFFVVEFLAGGDLLSYLRANAATLSEESGSSQLLLLAMTQIASAMAHLEKLRIVHRDLAARNVLVSEKGLESVKLSDVGLSRTLIDSPYYRMASRGAVPACWMAPESITERMFTSASDVWAFAVVVWETYSYGAEPYSSMSIEAAVRAVLKGYRMPRPPACSIDLYAVVLRCWQEDALERPTFKTIHYLLTDMLDDESSL
eukprot:m.361510 g.361510  ORF g.361510 m.361510 type:complete len:370 (+) comp56006_c1_seq1:1-1110(+)